MYSGKGFLVNHMKNSLNSFNEITDTGLSYLKEGLEKLTHFFKKDQSKFDTVREFI